ncbi:28 kDa inner dynein arm light chain, axonemal [Clonorchis sinensis]|uniref:28 kDa inner dynein arm light chain, axonemal n=2 Tax=Clonorchis sinensis TaxID=79923 RepID=A0A8T1MP84_CLOSI|nr:28 kDa inner dynein arm light chain, axonemal [Clonorchis sinensis]
MNSLLRYDVPVKENEEFCEGGKKLVSTGTPCVASEGTQSMSPACTTSGPCRLTKDDAVLQALSKFFPPVRYKEMGTKWVKHVSAKQATPIEMTHVKQEVDRVLKVRCSRKAPLCVIREDVLSDLIREILRQVTIDCPEQGLLLRRILDHNEMEFNAYETLLRFTDAFVGRKWAEWQHWKADRTRQIYELEDTKRILEFQATELKHKVDQLEKKNQEMKIKWDAARMEEVKYYKKTGEHLRAQMDVSVLPNR